MQQNKKIELLKSLWSEIDKWQRDAQKRMSIQQKIWDKWGADKSVMITDLSGCSRLTREYGIIHFLSHIRVSHLLYLPITNHHGPSAIE